MISHQINSLLAKLESYDVCMFVELTVVLKSSGSQSQGQGSGGVGWSFALSLCRKPAKYFSFTSDVYSAGPKMSLFLSWIAFSETQVCIDLKRKHLLKSSITL